MATIAGSIRRWATLTVLTVAAPIAAQDENESKVDVSINMRAEFSMENPQNGKSSAGFHGSYLNLMLKGELTPRLSYNFRHRLNKFKDMGDDVFSATDYVYLTYKPTQNLVLSGGKQVVAMGGYEYDAAPIDIYYSSLFWQNIACYQFGVSGSYITDDGHHCLTLQMCNSPFKNLGQSCFAYNLLWNGRMGFWHTLWSMNLLEQERGVFAQFYMLGNQFRFGRVTVDADFINRHYDGRAFLSNWSMIGKVAYRVSDKANVFVKGGHECFCGDPLTSVECKKPFASAGVEMRPIREYPSLRFHALWGLTTYQGQSQHNVMAGLTWNCNVYNKSSNSK